MGLKVAHKCLNSVLSDPTKVLASWNLAAGYTSETSYKVPTVVLFTENKEFHSFGYEAEDAYSELALDDEHKRYYFFKCFKTRLQGKKVCSCISICSAILLCQNLIIVS